MIEVLVSLILPGELPNGVGELLSTHGTGHRFRTPSRGQDPDPIVVRDR